METCIIGFTYLGMPIFGYRFGKREPSVVILAGVHGDEGEGIAVAYSLIARWSVEFLFNVGVIIIPMLNVDGSLNNQRKNGRGVDLNRNMPTKDWNPDISEENYFPGTHSASESETVAIMHLVEDVTPSIIISLHSWEHPVLNVNGDCVAEAEVARHLVGYDISDTIGYPTTGCLGTYYGIERGIPTLTYEIERGVCHKDVIAEHSPCIEEIIRLRERKI